jgi:hypothetical protein
MCEQIAIAHTAGEEEEEDEQAMDDYNDDFGRYVCFLPFAWEKSLDYLRDISSISCYLHVAVSLRENKTPQEVFHAF